LSWRKKEEKGKKKGKEKGRTYRKSAHDHSKSLRFAFNFELSIEDRDPVGTVDFAK
jgi:hypothetical protein